MKLTTALRTITIAASTAAIGLVPTAGAQAHAAPASDAQAHAIHEQIVEKAFRPFIHAEGDAVGRRVYPSSFATDPASAGPIPA